VTNPPIDLTDPAAFATGRQHPMFTWLREHDPVHFHEEAEGPGFWCLTKHADIGLASRDPALFSSQRRGVDIADLDEGLAARLVREWMILLDPPEHTAARAAVSRGFTNRRLSELEPVLKDRAAQIVDGLVGRTHIEVSRDLAAELPLFTIAEVLGVPEEDRREIFECAQEMMEAQVLSAGEMKVGERDRRRQRAGVGLAAHAQKLRQSTQRCPQSDFGGELLAAGAIDDFDRLFLMLFGGAGFETTHLTVTTGLAALLAHPDQFEQLRADRTLLDRAIEEMLRWTTPVQYFRRTATRDVELRGRHIRENDKVVLWYVSANRDEEIFEQPHHFDIRRPTNPHLSFGGGGPHYCLGASLARMELRILFAELLDRLPPLEVDGTVEWISSNFVSGVRRLPVRLRGSIAAS
jgi:cholest-4-en-3-one 26-monooxygenase